MYVTYSHTNKYKNQLKIDYKVGIVVIKSTKTRVVVMVTSARDIPTSTMKSSSDDYKVDVVLVTITTTLVLVSFITAIPTS